MGVSMVTPHSSPSSLSNAISPTQQPPQLQVISRCVSNERIHSCFSDSERPVNGTAGYKQRETRKQLFSLLTEMKQTQLSHDVILKKRQLYCKIAFPVQFYFHFLHHMTQTHFYSFFGTKYLLSKITHAQMKPQCLNGQYILFIYFDLTT